jgi:hypothetical protein
MLRMLGALLDLTVANSLTLSDKVTVLIALAVVLITQLAQRRFGDELWASWPVAPRAGWYAAALLAIAWLQPATRNPFLYFQF